MVKRRDTRHIKKAARTETREPALSGWQKSLPIGYATHRPRAFVTFGQWLQGAEIHDWDSLTERQRRDLTIARLSGLPRCRVTIPGRATLNRLSAVVAILSDTGGIADTLVAVEGHCIASLMRRHAAQRTANAAER